MKRLCLILSVLLLAAPAMAEEPLQLARMSGPMLGASAAADPCGCPTSTYMLCYTGDYPGDATKACYNSGDVKDAATSSADTITSDYVVYDAKDENISWAVSSGDILSDVQGTLFFTYTTPSILSGDNTLFEVFGSSENFIRVFYYGGSNYIRAYHKGNNNVQYVSQTAVTLSGATSYRIGYTWKVGNPGGHKLSVVALGNDPTWTAEDDSNKLTSFNVSYPPPYVSIGERSSGFTVTDMNTVSDLIITSGYGDDDPRQ